MTAQIPSLTKTIGELDAGSLEAMASHALRDIALAVRDIDRSKAKGKLQITLTVERAKGSGQLLVGHKIAYTRPTETGKASEEAEGDTLMYCGAGGALTVMPEAQMQFDLKTRTAEETQ